MKKNWKRAAQIFLLILLLIIGAGWYIYSHYESIVRNVLAQKTTELTHGLYRLELGAIRINLWNGYLYVKDVELKVNKERLEYLNSVDSLPEYYGDILIQEVALNGMDFRTERSFRRLHFSQLLISEPEVYITHHKKKQTDTLSAVRPSAPTPTLYESVSSVIDVCEISDIFFENGKVEFRNENGKDTLLYKIEKMNFHAFDFRLDSTSNNSDRLFYCNDFLLDAENVEYLLPSKSFALNLGKIALATSDSSLQIEKTHLIPQYPKKVFVFEAKDQSDWMELTVDKLSCFQVDYKKLLREKRLTIDSIHIQDAFYANFKDQHMVKPKRYIPLLHTLLHRIPIPVDIRRICVQNVDVEYEELVKNDFIPGCITFNGINGDFYGFTNQVQDSISPYIKLVATGKLMKQGVIHATFFLPVDSLENEFEIKGTLGFMNVQPLNRIVEPLASARIEKGTIQGMDFHIRGDDHQAQINMQLLYKDLCVAILKEKGGKKVDWQLASKLANMIIVKHNNPEPGKEARSVQVTTQRDPTRSSFNYLWRIFFSGLIETGALDARQKERIFNFKQNLDEVKSFFQSKKTKKKSKKI